MRIAAAFAEADLAVKGVKGDPFFTMGGGGRAACAGERERFLEGDFARSLLLFARAGFESLKGAERDGGGGGLANKPASRS